VEFQLNPKLLTSPEVDEWINQYNQHQGIHVLLYEPVPERFVDLLLLPVSRNETFMTFIDNNPVPGKPFQWNSSLCCTKFLLTKFLNSFRIAVTVKCLLITMLLLGIIPDMKNGA
jgi:hypothetical protein